MFFIVLDLRLTKVWVPAGTRFFCLKDNFLGKIRVDSVLLFLGRRLAKNAPVILHQFAYHEKDIDSRHTIGYQPCDIVALGVAFALDEGLVPKSCELGVILLDLVNQFFLAETDLLKRAEFLSGFFLNW